MLYNTEVCPLFSNKAYDWSSVTVTVPRVKVSIATLTDLNLLAYQTAIIQWRNFNKDMYKL